jgi:hypothetical protein
MVRVVLLAAVAACTLSCSAQACGYTATASARHPQARGHRLGLFIGDSTGVFAVPKLAARGISANAKECRQFTEAFSIIAARRTAGTLPHLVVLGLGANGPVSTRQIAAVLRAIGPKRVLGLVTPKNLAASAAAMRAMAARRPNRVLLIDWRAFSADHQSWFGGDNLHVNDSGATAFARFIKSRARGVIAPPGRALRRLRHIEPRHRCGRVRRTAGRPVRVFVLRGGVSCHWARTLGRRPPLRVHGPWTWLDWRPVHAGPWRDVYVRDHRRRIIATR